MRLSDVQMSRLRESASSLRERYPEITFHLAQAEEFDAQMTITSIVAPVLGRYAQERSSPQSQSADRAAFETAVGDAIEEWRRITGRTPASKRHQEPTQEGRTKITCTLTG